MAALVDGPPVSVEELRRRGERARNFYRELIRDLEQERAGSAPHAALKSPVDFRPTPNRRLREIVREWMRRVSGTEAQEPE